MAPNRAAFTVTLKNVFSLLFCLRLLLDTRLDRKKIYLLFDHLEPRFLLLLPSKSYYFSSGEKKTQNNELYNIFIRCVLIGVRDLGDLYSLYSLFLRRELPATLFPKTLPGILAGLVSSFISITSTAWQGNAFVFKLHLWITKNHFCHSTHYPSLFKSTRESR